MQEHREQPARSLRFAMYRAMSHANTKRKDPLMTCITLGKLVDSLHCPAMFVGVSWSRTCAKSLKRRRLMKKVLQRLTMLSFVVAMGGVMLSSTPSEAARRPIGGPCGNFYCLDVWDPVICSDGQVYSNGCYAARACATGCVRLGDQTE
jgi:hypothetical protein